MEKPRARIFSGSNKLNQSPLLPARDLQTKRVGRDFGRLADTPPHRKDQYHEVIRPGKNNLLTGAGKCSPIMSSAKAVFEPTGSSHEVTYCRCSTVSALDVGSEAPLTPVSMVSGACLQKKKSACNYSSEHIAYFSQLQKSWLVSRSISLHQQPPVFTSSCPSIMQVTFCQQRPPDLFLISQFSSFSGLAKSERVRSA